MSAEKILEKWYKPLMGIGEIAGLQLVEAMKEYATQVAQQVLKDASENVNMELYHENIENINFVKAVLNTEIKLP